MKITVVISSLSCGGAERVLSSMANFWVDHGNQITFITLASSDRDFYKLDDRINRVSLDLMKDSVNIFSAIKNNLTRLTHLRRVFKSYDSDVIISFQSAMNVMVLLAGIGMSAPIIVSERVDPRFFFKGVVWNTVRFLIYPLSAAVVVQSTDVKKWMSKIVVNKKIHIVPNPVSSFKKITDDKFEFDITSPFVVAMGRLVHQKGFDMLLQSFAQCAPEYEEWSLVIIGDGADRDKLESLSKKLHIEKRVRFVGRVTEPGAILERANMFVLSSRYEGFPNALCEAMSCSLPVVSFDCPSGPSSIVRNGTDGILVPAEDICALASAMDQLMKDENKRLMMGRLAKDIVHRFSMEKVMSIWEKLIHSLVRK